MLQRGRWPRGKRDYIIPPKNLEGGILTIDEYPVDKVYLMFEEGVYLTIF